MSRAAAATFAALATLGAIGLAAAAPARAAPKGAGKQAPVVTVAPPAPPPVVTPPPVAPPARPPENRRIVGILDVRVDGVAPEVAAVFQSNLESQLDTGHYWLASRMRIKQMMERSTKWTDGCFVGMCLRELRTQTGADLVVLASLTGSGTSYGYVVTLVRTDTGEVVSQEAERCDVCTATEAVDDATIATIKLVTSAPDKLPDEPALRVAALRDATTPLEQQLVAAKAASHHHTKRVGWTLALVGLAAAAVGTIVYVAHDNDHTGAIAAGVGAGLAASGVIVLTF